MEMVSLTSRCALKTADINLDLPSENNWSTPRHQLEVISCAHCNFRLVADLASSRQVVPPKLLPVLSLQRVSRWSSLHDWRRKSNLLRSRLPQVSYAQFSRLEYACFKIESQLCSHQPFYDWLEVYVSLCVSPMIHWRTCIDINTNDFIMSLWYWMDFTFSCFFFLQRIRPKVRCLWSRYYPSRGTVVNTRTVHAFNALKIYFVWRQVS